MTAPATVARDSVGAVQFNPEKMSVAGLSLPADLVARAGEAVGTP